MSETILFFADLFLSFKECFQKVHRFVTLNVVHVEKHFALKNNFEPALKILLEFWSFALSSFNVSNLRL